MVRKLQVVYKELIVTKMNDLAKQKIHSSDKNVYSLGYRDT